MSSAGSFPRWIRRLGSVALAGLAALALAEAAVRALHGPPMVNAYQAYDPDLGFRHVHKRTPCCDERGLFELATNSEGFFGPELPAPGAPKRARRVILLGDSFLHVWQVRPEDWVGTVLRDELARAAVPTEVYALCANDWGTGQELLALRLYGDRVQPDVIVLFLFTGNDLVNNTLELAGRTEASPGDYFRPYLVPDGSGALALRYALPWRARLRASRLFGLLEQRWLAGRTAAEARSDIAEGEPFFDGARAFSAPLSAPAPGDPWDTAWQRTETLVLAVRDEARLRGARFVTVVVPQVRQVEVDAPTAAVSALRKATGRGRPREELDLAYPERRLEAFFHREEIEHVQMLGPLRQRAAERGTTTYLRNGHLNGDAQALMGRALAARFEPGATDACFAGAGGPIDMLASYPEPPLQLALTQAPHWSLFGTGWLDWKPPALGPDLAGWPLERDGVFLVRPGFVTLEGVLTERSVFPVTLLVGASVGPRQTLAREVCAAAGPFTLRFALDARDGSAWIPLRLRLFGRPANAEEDAGSTTRLVLRSLRIDVEPPPGSSTAPEPLPSTR